jgi:transcriptional regulator with XRE-family HTH domain
MDSRKQKALEAAGWRFGDAADFLEMTEDERQLLDARVEAALAVRRQRKAAKLSQKQLACRIKTTQPRVAKIERAAPDVSLDQIFRAFAAAGGRISIRQIGQSAHPKTACGTRQGRRKRKEDAAEPRGDIMQIEMVGTETSRDRLQGS